MAKILKFPDSLAQSPEAFLLETRDIIADKQIVSVIVCMKQADGSMLSGYFNADFGTKQEMLGHIQVDIVDQMIRANMDKYVEYVNE